MQAGEQAAANQSFTLQISHLLNKAAELPDRSNAPDPQKAVERYAEIMVKDVTQRRIRSYQDSYKRRANQLLRQIEAATPQVSTNLMTLRRTLTEQFAGELVKAIEREVNEQVKDAIVAVLGEPA